MIKKALNNSNKSESTSKRGSPSIDTDCIYSYRMIPISAARVDKMIDDLREWPSLNPEAKTITAFYSSIGLTHSNYYRLLAKYPELKEAHDTAMRLIGERLWSNAVDRKADWAAVKHRLHAYGDEFKKDDEHHARLKAVERNDESTNGKVQYIVMDRVGDKIEVEK